MGFVYDDLMIIDNLVAHTSGLTTMAPFYVPFLIVSFDGFKLFSDSGKDGLPSMVFYQ